MNFETLKYERRDSAAILTLNRPDRHNAINSVMARELPAAWAEIDRDPQVRVAIVTGAGEKSLCTGFDVSDIASDTADVKSMGFTSLQCRVWKPVITAVNGMVCGGGLHFVADSDLVIAAEQATFFDTHVNVGLIAGMEPIVLARKMSIEPLMRLSLVGRSDRMNARRAMQLGIIGEVVAKENLLSRALELARLIAENSPAACARTKRALWDSLNMGLDDAREMGWKVIEDYWTHPDTKEGARAFAEKRKPSWARPEGK